MRGITIYAEGGGNTVSQKAELRTGLDTLLGAVKTRAREKKLSWKLVCCGGRQAAFNAFMNARNEEKDTICVLLVDSETSLGETPADPDLAAQSRVAHLKTRDGWDFKDAPASNVHLMVECMEAWIVADVDALSKFYGQGFNKNALPSRQNLEEEPKVELYKKLALATKSTKKGEYGKIKHASQILAKIDAAIVGRRCLSFASFTTWLESKI